MKISENYKFNMPMRNDGDIVDVDVISQNFEKIDKLINTNEVAIAQLEKTAPTITDNQYYINLLARYNAIGWLSDIDAFSKMIDNVKYSWNPSTRQFNVTCMNTEATSYDFVTLDLTSSILKGQTITLTVEGGASSGVYVLYTATTDGVATSRTLINDTISWSYGAIDTLSLAIKTVSGYTGQMMLKLTVSTGKSHREIISAIAAVSDRVTALEETGGATGVDGKSAYDIWLEQGNTGSEADFIASLKGDKGDKGDSYTLTEEDKAEIVETVKAEVPLVKTAEQPTFVNSIDEMTDTSKVYVMPDGYLWKYGETENYNLLKLSEVSYSSRLQDDVEGIISSNTQNVVTGWIPVEYGKYYTPSVLLDGSRIAGSNVFNLVRRVNLKLSDGSIVVYSASDIDTNNPVESHVANNTIRILYENAVAVMIHLYISGNDISTAEKLGAYQPMVVEGNSVDDATNKSLTYEYIDGDEESVAEWSNTGLNYNLPSDYEERIIKLEKAVENPISASPYYRDVNFGVLPFAYYKGVADSYENSAFGWTTQYADYMTMWKSLVANHTNYVTETTLGTASDGQTVYLYDFKPVRISNQDKPIPKVIIIAGQHGGETANIFGLYYFVNNLLNKWNEHSALEYLRNNIELMIVPVLNTYGFDNRSYKNANGVNLNRNYDSNWAFVEDTTSNQYGGAEPFDQPETQIVRDLLLSNTDAVLVVDSHVNGGGVVSNYSDINYYGISESTDVYFNRMVSAVAHNLSSISANFNLDYELGQPNTILGFLNHSDGTGIMRNWGRDQNIVTVLVEGFGGFPNGTAFTAEVFKANEEIFVNWLITALNYLAK